MPFKSINLVYAKIDIISLIDLFKCILFVTYFFLKVTKTV